MWSCRLAFASLFLIAGSTHAEEAKCPAHQGINVLASATLFDGPPSEMASLTPDISRGSGDHAYSSWDVRYLFDAGRKLYLVCQYAGTEKTTTIKVDKKVKQCIYRTHTAHTPAELSCK